MAVLSSITIRGSVGWKAKNDPTDVRAIQTRLNALMKPPRAALVVDGKCGPKTEAMILDFQKVAMKVAQPDAKVDPGGATLRALNDAASGAKWSQSVSAPPSAPPPAGNPGSPGAPGTARGRYPTGATPNEKQAIDQLAASAKNSGSSAALEVLDLMTQDANYGHFKNFLNGVGTAQWAGEFGYAIRGLKAAGLDNRIIYALFKDIANSPIKDIKAFSDLLKGMKENPAFAGAVGKLSKVGNALNVAAVLFCAMEVINHFKNGRPGAAIAEIYGTTMQILIPWAGAIDAVQGIIFAYAPSMKTNSSFVYFFRYLNAINPIGCGKTAVDSVVTIIETAVISYQKGSFDESKMQLLVTRMKQTPMNVFVQWGELLGDYMGDKFGDFYYQHFLK